MIRWQKLDMNLASLLPCLRLFILGAVLIQGRCVVWPVCDTVWAASLDYRHLYHMEISLSYFTMSKTENCRHWHTRCGLRTHHQKEGCAQEDISVGVRSVMFLPNILALLLDKWGSRWDNDTKIEKAFSYLIHLYFSLFYVLLLLLKKSELYPKKKCSPILMLMAHSEVFFSFFNRVWLSFWLCIRVFVCVSEW